ncbi:MAG: TRL domain-containing protein, partial [Planctomycetota bacterium]
MRRCLAGALAAFLLLLPGCLYAKVTVPLDTDLQETNLGDKTGKSLFQSVLWLFAWGDAGTQAAARDGG